MNNNIQIIPTKKGQIVRIFNPIEGEDPNKEYLLGEDPSPYGNDKQLQIYPLSEIKKYNEQGGLPFSDNIPKGDLTMIGESLEEYLNRKT